MPYNPNVNVGQAGSISTGILQGGQDAGFFSATGSPLLRAQLRRHAARQARNRMRSGAILGRVAGLDPMAQRQAFVDQNQAVNADTANTIDQGYLNDLQGGQDFARSTLGSQRGYEEQRYRDWQAAEAAKKARKAALLGGIGKLAGAGLGTVLGPAGTAIGAKVGGWVGGSPGGGGDYQGDEYQGRNRG